MKKEAIITIFALIFLINTSYAVGEENFYYINFLNDDNLETNKVFFGLEYAENSNYSFTMDIYYNGELQDETCQNNIVIDTESFLEKITCDVPKYGIGEYKFKGVLYDENGDIHTETLNIIYLNNEISEGVNMQFYDNDDETTTISIQVRSNESIIITNEIPKSVIESLTNENKDNLITSNIEYKILDEDPLIAWNIEEPPVNINYTINKKITQQEQEQFKLNIENSSTFKGVKYTIFIVMLIIIGFIFKPLFTKKNQKN